MTPLGRLWGVKHAAASCHASKPASEPDCTPATPSHTSCPSTNRPGQPVLAAPKPPAPEPNENPPAAGFAAAGVLKLNPPEAAGAPKPPDAGAGAPKGLEVGVPKAGVEEAPKGEDPPKAGVLDAPKMPPPELGAPKPVLPNAGVDAAVQGGIKGHSSTWSGNNSTWSGSSSTQPGNSSTWPGHSRGRKGSRLCGWGVLAEPGAVV